MKHRTYVAASAVGLVLAACSSSPNANNATSAPATATKTVTASVSQATTTTSSNSDLQALIPAPANTQRTDGPDSVQENGTHLHFLVNGSPTDVMAAYKTALEGKSWAVTVQNSGGGGGGGGATYTGTNGNAYGVFDGGGYGSTTDIDACVWPSKPSDASCGHRR
jgi:hypothetical protein